MFSDRYHLANSADPDETAPSRSSLISGLHCLLFHLHCFDEVP